MPPSIEDIDRKMGNSSDNEQPLKKFKSDTVNVGIKDVSTTNEISKPDNSLNSTNKISSKKPKGKKFKRKTFKKKPVDETSPSGVLEHEISTLLSHQNLTSSDIKNDLDKILNAEINPEEWHCVVKNVEILDQASNGDGISIIQNPHLKDSPDNIGSSHIFVIIPYSIIGDVINIKLRRTFPSFVECDILEIVKPSPHRNDNLINCRYFGKCSGCQYQMIPYETQLIFKRKVIENAYKYYFYPLLQDKSLQLDIGDTIGSPKQYEYRTKLTPHFDVPRKRKLEAIPPIGFGMKGSSKVLDIEECSIGTDIVNLGLTRERAIVHEKFNEYKKGVTILLREHTTKVVGTEEYTQECVSNQKQMISEYVEGKRFDFPAGSFFQNNNLILPLVCSYVRKHIQGMRFLVDAYCGSGLFAVTCSESVEQVFGVEISEQSVTSARHNAEINQIKNADFIVGDAERIFARITSPASETAIIVDPPRKGCGSAFMEQLAFFAPEIIVYVSCNVHSQARDLADLLNTAATKPNKDGGMIYYQIESIRGFDFFPQTHHVESVAVLRRKGSN